MPLFDTLWTISVDDVISTFKLTYDQTAGASDINVCSDASQSLLANTKTVLLAMLAADARFEDLYVRQVTDGTRPAWRNNQTQAFGTNSGPDSMSAQNCLLINLRNNAGELKRSGRIFVSGTPKTAIPTGVFSGAFLSGPVKNFMDKLITVPPAAGSDWGGKLVVRRTYIDGVKQVPPVTVDVTSVDATAEVGTQHVRKGRLTGLATSTAYPNLPNP